MTWPRKCMGQRRKTIGKNNLQHRIWALTPLLLYFLTNTLLNYIKQEPNSTVSNANVAGTK